MEFIHVPLPITLKNDPLEAQLKTLHLDNLVDLRGVAHLPLIQGFESWSIWSDQPSLSSVAPLGLDLKMLG